MGHIPDSNVIIEILDSWPRLVKLVIAVVVLAAIALSVALIVMRRLPSDTSEVQIGSSHILFQHPTAGGQGSVLVVCPQGWNQTGISVSEHQRFEIHAGGKVNVDLEGLIKALDARRSAEARVMNSVQAVAEGTAAPEDYFTDQEKQNIVPTWGWSGPDGVSREKMKALANKERARRCILPGEPYGELVGAFNSVDADPEDYTRYPRLAAELESAAFPIKSSCCGNLPRKGSGYLYFAVNDVIYRPVPGYTQSRNNPSSNPEAMSKAFFTDNIGTYYVKLTVSDK